MRISSVLALSVLLGAACTTHGTGQGQLEAPANVAAEKGSDVKFTWKSDGGSVTKGTMQATVPGHGTFSGNYMQITSEADAKTTGPYFGSAWYPNWSDWDGWGGEGAAVSAAGGSAFITNYSGMLLSVLRSENGEHLRCRFHLAEPAAGPDGGGLGECQLSTQEIIRDVELKGD